MEVQLCRSKKWSIYKNRKDFQIELNLNFDKYHYYYRFINYEQRQTSLGASTIHRMEYIYVGHRMASEWWTVSLFHVLI